MPAESGEHARLTAPHFLNTEHLTATNTPRILKSTRLDHLMKTPRIFTTSIAAAVALLHPTPALNAADRFWVDPTGDSFSSTPAWSLTDGGAGGASVPGAADVANFTLNNTYLVFLSSNITNVAMDVSLGTVNFDLNGNSYQTTSVVALDIGDVVGQTGRLTITNGAFGVGALGNDVRLGLVPGGTGFLTVSTGAILGTAALRPDFLIGTNFGTGTLTVNDNGQVFGFAVTMGATSGNSGTLTITGPNAVMSVNSINAGDEGASTVTVSSGGTLTTAAAATLGISLGGDGTATVTGTGSAWSVSGFTTIGEGGDGALTISSGGLVSTASSVALGSNVTGVGTATVTGAGSRWNLASTQTIGSGGLGVMTVSSGGQVISTSSAILGFNAGSEGRATVTGTGSSWTLGSSIIVGNNGTGEFTVSGGGEVVSGGLSVGNGASGSGTATITGAGSKLTSTGSVSVAPFGPGTLTVENGGEFSTSLHLSVNDPAGAAIGTVNLNGGSIYVAGDFTNNGVFNFSDGLLQVKGNFQPSATLAGLTLNGASTDDLPTLDLLGFSTTTNVSTITVGDNRRGQLLLRQGRVINAAANVVNIGASVGGEGTLSVESGAQLLAVNTLAVGGLFTTAGGTGSLNIAGGSVDTINLRIFNDGTVNLSSGTLGVDATPVLDGQFNWTGGTLRFDASTALASTNVPKLLGFDGTINAGQTLASTAVMTIQTPVIVDGGALTPSTLINQSTLEVRTGSASVTGTTTNEPGAQIFVQRNLSLGGTLANNAGGRIELVGGTGRLLGAGTITNAGLVTGDGTVTNVFNNVAGGEVRAEFGKTLYFTGATGANAGRLSLLGGSLSFAQPFTNSATGQINGQGALCFPTSPIPSNASPNAGLMNAGNINLTGGDSQIYGTVQMQAGSRLIVSGGATASFFDVFRHSGLEVRASAGSNIVFFAEVRGAGSFTGTGTIYFESAYSPGNSPAAVVLNTGVILGDANTLTLEIGGLSAGSEYDQLVLGAGASLTLDGELVLDLIDGFAPALGDTFHVFDFDPGQVTGSFDEITLADALPGGLSFDTSTLSTTGKIAVVPEPGVSTLLLSVFAMLGLRRAKTAALSR